MKIKVEAIIEVHDAYGDFKNKEELEWFKEIMSDKKQTFLILHSNDLGDVIGETYDFKYKIL